eukprot:Lithocolla_globosa_v1_NODE_410_length_4127_cov_7.757859.p2 type:complete len:108 gc:universal NODE_410_length_4127_cov_7.757859:1892-1569(-)
MRGDEIERRNRQTVPVLDQGFNEQLGTLDVGDQRNAVVDGQASRHITPRDVATGSSKVVLGRKVDVKIQHAFGKQVIERMFPCMCIFNYFLILCIYLYKSTRDIIFL